MSTSASVYDFWDYKAYLDAALASSSKTQTGLAEAMRCQPAYLSRVLRGEAHLSSDQAYLASKHLGHSSDERRFFLHLVQHNRASSPEIQNYYRAELQAILTERLDLKRRLTLRQPLKTDQQAAYYGSWLHCAVHMALTIPGLNQPSKIAAYLGAQVESVRDSLDLLCSIGVAEESEGAYRATDQRIHLESQSTLIARHHTNWRLAALRKLENPQPGSFHYSSVVSVGEKDLYEVQLILTEAIERIRGVVRESPAEHVACYNLDFFKLGTD